MGNFNYSFRVAYVCFVVVYKECKDVYFYIV